MAANLHKQMEELSLTDKGIFKLTKGLEYTPVTIDALIKSCSNPTTLHIKEAEDIGIAIALGLQAKYPDGGEIDVTAIATGYNKEGNKFTIQLPNAAYSRAALTLKVIDTTTANDVTYKIELDEHVVAEAKGAQHSESFTWGTCKIYGGEHLSVSNLAVVLMNTNVFPLAGLKLSTSMHNFGVTIQRSETGMLKAGMYNISGIEEANPEFPLSVHKFPEALLNIKHGPLTLNFYPNKTWCAYLGICFTCLKFKDGPDGGTCMCARKDGMEAAKRSLHDAKMHNRAGALQRKLARIKGSATASRGCAPSSEA